MSGCGGASFDLERRVRSHPCGNSSRKNRSPKIWSADRVLLGAKVFGYSEDVGGGSGVEHGVQFWQSQRDLDDVDQTGSAGHQLMTQQPTPGCVGQVQFVIYIVDFDDAFAICVGDPAGAQGS